MPEVEYKAGEKEVFLVRQTRFGTWRAMFVNIVVSGDCEELLWQWQCLSGLEGWLGLELVSRIPTQTESNQPAKLNMGSICVRVSFDHLIILT